MRLLAFLILFFSYQITLAQSSKTNPDISVNGLFLYQSSDQGNSSEENSNGFNLQEVELRMTSNIDTYFRGDVTLAIEKEDGEFLIEPEEVYIETLSIPQVTLKAGKYYALWGRHNNLHTHAYPFIDAILSKDLIFGEEGLNETGLSAAYLAPTPWYLELTAQILDGSNQGVFGSASNDDVAAVYFIKNLFDLTSDSTVEVDIGWGHGRNIENQLNHIYNGSLTYKWRPAEAARTTSFLWTAEYSMAEKVFDEDGSAQGRTGVFSSWIQYQFATRWWTQLRTEFADFIDQPDLDQMKKHSVLVGYVPSEFSALRLQYDHIDDPREDETESRWMLQLNVSIGAHPAHGY